MIGKNTDEGDFRGLLFEPAYENEVIVLFGMLIPYLEDGFTIDSFRGDFPDCFAKRNGQKIGIEFEVSASDFYKHEHDLDDRLHLCNLLICWENDIPWKTVIENSIEFLIFESGEKKHKVEVLTLNKIIKKLQAEKSIMLILNGKRPSLDRGSKEEFFKQLKENIDDRKYRWIEELYNQLREDNRFEVRWGGGERWYTMRIFVKKWEVDPMSVQGDGKAYIVYSDNPGKQRWWELPRKTQSELRRLFRHEEKRRWPSIPLETREDLENIRKVLKIMVEDSVHYEIVWHEQR